MRFEEIVEELYERYARVVEKEAKIEKVGEKARELGFEDVEVEFNEKTEEARAAIELDEETIIKESYKKLREMAEWLVGESCTVYSLKLLITTERKKFESTGGMIGQKAQQLGIGYAGYVEQYDDEYIDYFELERDESGVFVYLLIYSEHSN